MAGTGGGESRVLDVVFLAPGGRSNAPDLLDALRGQSITTGQVTIVEPSGDGAGLGAALAARSDRPIALLDADLVVSGPPLGAVLDDPRLGTAALAELTGPASSGVELLGVLRVDAADRALASSLLERRGGPSEPRQAGEPGEPGLLGLVRGLQADGVEVTPVPLTGYVWAQPGDATEAAAARAAAAALPERRVRLREAARGGDGFYSTFVLRRLSWRCTDVALRLGLTPNQVTVISLLLGLVAAGCLATDRRGWMALGAVLLQVCLIVDCVDGELARFRRRFSRFGAWLDATTDRVKEFAAIAGLAVAADRHGTPVWWLAALAIGVQTFRHLFELGWALQREYATGGITPARPQWRANQVRLRFKSVVRPAQDFDWLRRLGHLPIGERFLLMSLGALLGAGRGTLALLIAAGLLAAAYMLAAFVVRSRSARAPAPRLRAMLDAGPLARVLPALPPAQARRVTATLPAVLAALELLALWQLVTRLGAGSAPAALALLAAAAIAHYQQVYGVREHAAGARSLTLGADGRLLAAAAIAVAARLAGDPGIATVGAWALAVLVAVDTVRGSLTDWFSGPPAPAPPEVSAPSGRPVAETAGGNR